MKNPYFETVLWFITLSLFLFIAIGVANDWDLSTICYLTFDNSKWIFLIFIPYLFLSIPKIRANKNLSNLFIFLPAIIISTFILKHYYQIYSGQILKGGFSTGSFFNFSQIKLVFAGAVIIANYRLFKKQNLINPEA